MSAARSRLGFQILRHERLGEVRANQRDVRRKNLSSEEIQVGNDLAHRREEIEVLSGNQNVVVHVRSEDLSDRGLKARVSGGSKVLRDGHRDIQILVTEPSLVVEVIISVG